jgi:hypothetical protein
VSRSRYQASDNTGFIDALREVLGLAPLFADPARTEVERFARSYPTFAGWKPARRAGSP